MLVAKLIFSGAVDFVCDIYGDESAAKIPLGWSAHHVVPIHDMCYDGIGQRTVN